jgi:uncharacterized membrane protein
MMRSRLPWLLAVAYAVIFTLLGAQRYAVHRNLVDFGIFEQTTASAFGCFCNAIEGSHWAFHFSPILYVAGAALLIWKSPVTLIALQSIACALVIPPVYGIVARRTSTQIAAFTAIIVAVSPSLAGLAFGDFHENGFAPAAVAWAAWAFDGGFIVAAIVASLFAIGVKEDQAIFVGLSAVVIAWRFRGTSAGRAAILVAFLGFGAASAFFFAIQPHHVASAHWAPERFYAWTGGDLAALVPTGILQRVGFLAITFAAFGFLPLYSRTIVFAIPPLAEVLLSRMSTTFTPGTHYTGAWLGYVIVAFAFAARKMKPARAAAFLRSAAVLSLVILSIANPMHPGLNLRAVQPRDTALDAELQALPRDVSVATQEEAYTHLSLRDPYATLLPESADLPEATCFVLTDAAFPSSPRYVEYGRALAALVRSRTYALVKRSGGIALYRRTTPCR